MLVLMERGHSRETIQQLNRVRIHLQVIFLSDVLTASGNRVDANTLCPQPATNRQPVLNWPKEEPTAADMMLWREALKDICPIGNASTALVHMSRSPTGYKNGDSVPCRTNSCDIFMKPPAWTSTKIPQRNSTDTRSAS